MITQSLVFHDSLVYLKARAARGDYNRQLSSNSVSSCRFKCTPEPRPTVPAHHAKPCQRIQPTACHATDFSGGSGGGRSDSRRTSGGGDDWRSHRGMPVVRALTRMLFTTVKLLAIYLVLQIVAAAALDVFYALTLPHVDTSELQLSVVVPVLNEGACLAQTLEFLKGLAPAILEVIVVDGGSTDGTIAVARKYGARVIHSKRGRAAQMNAGAAAAQGDLLCFLHADTHPPKDLVNFLRHKLSSPRTVLVGFTPSIEVPGRRLWFMSIHNFMKSLYLPMALQPHTFIQGGRFMFGDQMLCCRKADFAAVGGYNSALPIMEDGDLCLRLHAHGPAAGGMYQGKGRCIQAVERAVVTSGRRLAAWGNWKATRIHFTIGLAWYRGVPPDQLWQLYQRLYRDDYR